MYCICTKQLSIYNVSGSGVANISITLIILCQIINILYYFWGLNFFIYQYSEIDHWNVKCSVFLKDRNILSSSTVLHTWPEAQKSVQNEREDGTLQYICYSACIPDKKNSMLVKSPVDLTFYIIDSVFTRRESIDSLILLSVTNDGMVYGFSPSQSIMPCSQCAACQWWSFSEVRHWAAIYSVAKDCFFSPPHPHTKSPSQWLQAELTKSVAAT